jgi:hypothetical protein
MPKESRLVGRELRGGILETYVYGWVGKYDMGGVRSLGGMP